MQRHTTISAIICAALAVSSTAVFASERHARYTPEQKQASDQQVQAGLGQLQAAKAALQQGSVSGSIADLQSAEADFNQSLRIYHGHREHAIHAASHAIRELQRNTRKSDSHAVERIDEAISEAQAALQTN